MACFMSNRVPSEHVGHEKHQAIEMNCPALYGQRICLWCCLHIEELADPARRMNAEDRHPEYYNVVPKVADMSWDEIWETCSSCGNRKGGM